MRFSISVMTGVPSSILEDMIPRTFSKTNALGFLPASIFPFRMRSHSSKRVPRLYLSFTPPRSPALEKGWQGEASKKNIVVRYFIKLNLANILLDAISCSIVIRDVFIEAGHSIAIEIIGVDNFGGQTSKMFTLEIDPPAKPRSRLTASRKERRYDKALSDESPRCLSHFDQ